MPIVDPQQLVDHAARVAAPGRVLVHTTTPNGTAGKGRGGLTAEVVAVLQGNQRVVFSLGQVLKRVRDTAQASDVNSILHKLVVRRKVTQSKVSNGVRLVNGYQWTEKQKGKP